MSNPRSRLTVLEAGQPLSRSLLWRLQRNFYERQGPAAWTAGALPQSITSNPWIADAYARVVLGWLRDGAAAGAIDPGRPVHLIELGAGSGRFGYLFLRRLRDLLDRSSLAHLRLRYVLTDFAESNVSALRCHPALRPLAQAGHLDFARYDAGSDVEIRLLGTGETLAPGTLGNPLCAIANYLFDSLPQDCFRVTAEGELRELRVTLSSPRPELILDDPELLGRVRIAWEEAPVAGDPYGEPGLDRLLAGYRERLRDTHLLFPVGALRTVLKLALLAGDRLLLLAGDKGYCHEAMLHGREAPGVAIHGCLSMMVNFHALGRLFEERGGAFLHTSALAPDLAVVAGLLGPSPDGPAGAAETRLAFDEAIERGSPSDFFQLKTALEASAGSLSLPQLLAWLRLSGWDPNVFLKCAAPLLQAVESATEAERQDLRRDLHRVWESWFPGSGPHDLAFELGVLFCQLGCHVEALPYFERSLALHGANPATSHNLGLCCFHLGRLDEALAHVEEALAAAPDLAEAAVLRAEIEAALGSR
jgi:tetratricopeptide repeat protein/putative S-adenosyl-L-methionine-dependent methyltransferase